MSNPAANGLLFSRPQNPRHVHRKHNITIFASAYARMRGPCGAASGRALTHMAFQVCVGGLKVEKGLDSLLGTGTMDWWR